MTWQPPPPRPLSTIMELSILSCVEGRGRPAGRAGLARICWASRDALQVRQNWAAPPQA